MVYILLATAGALLFYQMVIYQDPDKLDSRGRPIKRRNRDRIF
jgi:hypothetical protein